nr:putative integron gene cassette protein [uncultured bacterium]
MGFVWHFSSESYRSRLLFGQVRGARLGFGFVVPLSDRDAAPEAVTSDRSN